MRWGYSFFPNTSLDCKMLQHVPLCFFCCCFFGSSSCPDFWLLLFTPFWAVHGEAPLKGMCGCWLVFFTFYWELYQRSTFLNLLILLVYFFTFWLNASQLCGLRQALSTLHSLPWTRQTSCFTEPTVIIWLSLLPPSITESAHHALHFPGSSAHHQPSITTEKLEIAIFMCSEI